METSSLIRALAIQSPSNAPVIDITQDGAEPDRKTGVALLNYIALNRLVDVVSWVEDHPPNRSIPSQKGMEDDKASYTPFSSTMTLIMIMAAVEGIFRELARCHLKMSPNV